MHELNVRYAFGSAYPLLANQTSEVLDPLDYWWALTWSPLLDLDIITQEQEQKLYVDFQKAQYSLLHVLSENFGTHEKQIIADHDPVQLVAKLTAKHTVDWDEKLEFPDRQGWTPTKWMTTWLPFGYMCLHNIAAKYIDTGVTDAITKMAKLGNAQREALLQEANALLVDMADALVKKNKKNVKIEEEDEEEAGVAELLDNTHTPTASPNPKLKEKKTAQDDELDRTLASCTVQRFAGCSVPSNFSL